MTLTAQQLAILCRIIDEHLSNYREAYKGARCMDYEHDLQGLRSRLAEEHLKAALVEGSS